jgi:uncharacterized membrane protein
MDQQWLTVIGLALDFLGFCLVLREWWLAFFNEEAQLRMEENLERTRALRHLSRAHRDPTERNPYESLERIQDEASLRKAREIYRASRRSRRAIFMLAAVLIVAGFALQILGAVPGCCPPFVVAS